MIKQSLNLYLLISFFLVLASIKVTATSEKSFVIITASYNNKDWYQRNLDSIFFPDLPELAAGVYQRFFN